MIGILLASSWALARMVLVASKPSISGILKLLESLLIFAIFIIAFTISVSLATEEF